MHWALLDFGFRIGDLVNRRRTQTDADGDRHIIFRHGLPAATHPSEIVAHGEFHGAGGLHG